MLFSLTVGLSTERLLLVIILSFWCSLLVVCKLQHELLYFLELKLVQCLLISSFTQRCLFSISHLNHNEEHAGSQILNFSLFTLAYFLIAIEFSQIQNLQLLPSITIWLHSLVVMHPFALEI